MPEEKNVNAINFGEEFDTNGEFSLIDDGKYEVVIEKVEPKESQKGNKYLNVVFKIRNDVDQNFKNRKLFYRINSKEGDVCYDFNRVNKIIITQKNTANYKKFFIDVDEVLQYLVGLHLVLTVETSYDEYSQKDRNNVKDWSFEPSVWDTQEHPAKVVEEHTEGLDLPDAELPF
jgi:hypothetical protein